LGSILTSTGREEELKREKLFEGLLDYVQREFKERRPSKQTKGFDLLWMMYSRS